MVAVNGHVAREESAGTGISERLRSAGDSINGVPLVATRALPTSTRSRMPRPR